MGFDDTPQDRADAESGQKAAASPPAKTVAVARLLLFLLLVGALAGLAYDLLAKRKLNQAFATMEQLNQEQDQIVGKMGIDEEKVRGALGREPDYVDASTNEHGQPIDVEHYAFGGVFYNYTLNVRYLKKTGHMVKFEQDPVFRIGGR